MSTESEAAEQVFGRRLREVRTSRGLTLAEAAELIEAKGGPKLDHSQLSRIERGQRPVRLDEAAAIAGAFGKAVSDLLVDSESWDRADMLDELMRQANDQAEVVEATRARLAAAVAQLEQITGSIKYLQGEAMDFLLAGGADGEHREEA